MSTPRTTPDPFEHTGAAYVFGALDPAEKAQFETHLATCDACTAQVAEARGLTSMLADIGEAEVTAEVPDTLLPGLLRRASSSRRRQRWLTTGLAAGVAACLVTIAILAWPSNPAQHVDRTVALTAVVTSPVRASAELTQTSSGTKIRLHCTYTGRSGSEPTALYWLVVTDKHGNPTKLSNWRLGPGEDQVFEATTGLSEDQIDHIDVTYASHPILTAKL